MSATAKSAEVRPDLLRIPVVTIVPREHRIAVNLQVSQGCLEEIWRKLLDADPYQFGGIRDVDRLAGPMLILQAVTLTGDDFPPREVAR